MSIVPITAYDMVELRKLILSIDSDFQNNTSWRFVEADYTFTEANPLTEVFPEVGQIEQLSGDMVMDFTAVKIGDINGNAQPNSFFQAEVRTSPEIFELQIPEQNLKAGQTYEVPVSTQQLSAVQGYQFTLNFATLQIAEVQGKLMQKEHFGLQGIDKGWMTASWNATIDGQGLIPLANGNGATTPLFILHIKALQDAKLSEVLTINSRPTSAEAYDQDGREMTLQLTFTDPVETAVFDLFQNEPNPFKGQTTIAYNLPANSDVTLILRDETGRILRTLQQEGQAGYNQIQLSDLDLQPGFIYYQLNTKFGSKSKKMLRIE